MRRIGLTQVGFFRGRRLGGHVPLVLVAGLMAGCGGDVTDPPPPPPPPPSSTAQCSSQSVLQLAVGAHQVVDPTQTNGCVRVPQAGSGGAEYLVVVASTATNRSAAGISGGYQLRASNPTAAATAVAPVSRVDGFEPAPRRVRTAADLFHDHLRSREAALAADPANRGMPLAPPVATAPPVVGDVRTFKACANVSCSSFVDVAATARYVGTKAAIYMDNSVPTADTLRDVDYDDLGQTFDNHHYPIDLAAFGPESDIDGNERIVILMTDAVNNLTPDCTNGRVLGYFFGLDLITTGAQAVNSNKAEVFYTFVPAPANSSGTCNAISRSSAVNNVKPTLIHELQHMISWNRRVLQGGGNSEETWLNEAMSHFAEELGGRLIPNSECVAAGFSSCRSQYISSDIINTHDYLQDTEGHYLIYPTSSNGTLEERGASWFFLRWVIDQFATDTILGTDFTPSLVTGPGGGASIAARTGTPFSQLVPEWLMAAYLDDLPNFTAASPRLRLRSWGLRSIWTDPRNSQIFPGGFPLKPDSTSGGYSRIGTLRGGSGRHLRLIQQANGPAIDVQLLRDAQGTAIDPALVPRIGIVRIR